MADIADAGQESGPSYGLAWDTSGRTGSVALGRGAEVLATAEFPTGVSHAAQLLPAIDRVCRAAGVGPADIAWVAVSGGPGSFTGLRVGATCARMLALAYGVRVVRVPTMAVIAQNALRLTPPPDRVAVLLDAQRGHVYAAAFERRGQAFVALEEPVETEALAYVQRAASPRAVIGEGAARLMGLPAAAVVVTRLPTELDAARAEVVYALGWSRVQAGDFDDPRRLVPIYIRMPSAEEVWKSAARRSLAEDP